MLGCLRRRGARKMPKRLRALHFRTVGPWLYLGLIRGNAGRAIGSKPAPIVLHTARCPRRACSGKLEQAFVIGKRRGISHLARGTRSRGGRGGDLVDVPVRCLSHLQRSTGGFGPEKPFSRYVILRKKEGSRGGRGPGLRMYPIVPSRVRCHRRPVLSERSSSLRSYAWRREP